MDHIENIILVSYVSGSFGSSLVNLLMGSSDCVGEFKMFNPNVKHWHRQKWIFDPQLHGGFITENTIIDPPTIVNDTSKYIVGQFHNMNALTLKKHFSKSKIIMLSVNKKQFKYALHRWWKTVGFDEKQIHGDRIGQISAAHDVITYNTKYYAETKIMTENNKNVLTIEFDNVLNSIVDIEQFLGITLVPAQIEIYKTFITPQLNTFYKADDNFIFAWEVISKLGKEAPIIDLANNFSNTQELKKYLNEQK